ncbi:unnamed protein product [Closterium sp. NIES-64]|nr:unnamed protein product [Closterium sp. NIES-64]
MAAYLFGPVRQQPQPQPQPAPQVPPPGARATFDGARDFVFADAREGRGHSEGRSVVSTREMVASTPRPNPKGGYQTKGMAERLLLASAVEGEDELHLDVVAEGEAVALQGRALAGEVEECPPRPIAEGRGVADQTSRGLVVEYGKCRSVGPAGSRGMPARDGPALQVEGGESRLVGLLEGRGVQEQDGPALEVEGGESRLVGLLRQGGAGAGWSALEVEGGESRLVGLLEGRGVPEQDGPALEVEGGESRLVGSWRAGGCRAGWSGIGGGGRGVPLGGPPGGQGGAEQDGPALEVEGGESRLVGLLEGRGVPEQDGPALEVEGGESRLVGLLEGRGVPEQDGPALEVEGGESRLVGLLEGRWGPEQDGALTTVGNPGARAFDVNTVLRRAREWYRAEDIDTGRTTGTQGSEMGGFTEHFHPASALALPWPDCGQRENIPAQGPDEPASEDDPVPVDAREDGDEAADDEGEPGIHTRGGKNEFQWRSFNVNLDARTCECGNWEEYQFPCAHAVAMCILKQRSVEILVSEYYTTRNLRQTYTGMCKYKYGGYGQAQLAVGEEVEEEEEEEEGEDGTATGEHGGGAPSCP